MSKPDLSPFTARENTLYFLLLFGGLSKVKVVKVAMRCLVSPFPKSQSMSHLQEERKKKSPTSNYWKYSIEILAYLFFTSGFCLLSSVDVRRCKADHKAIVTPLSVHPGFTALGKCVREKGPLCTEQV